MMQATLCENESKQKETQIDNSPGKPSTNTDSDFLNDPDFNLSSICDSPPLKKSSDIQLPSPIGPKKSSFSSNVNASLEQEKGISKSPLSKKSFLPLKCSKESKYDDIIEEEDDANQEMSN